jgi:hypothetical protein
MSSLMHLATEPKVRNDGNGNYNPFMHFTTYFLSQENVLPPPGRLRRPPIPVASSPPSRPFLATAVAIASGVGGGGGAHPAKGGGLFGGGASCGAPGGGARCRMCLAMALRRSFYGGGHSKGRPVQSAMVGGDACSTGGGAG